MLLILLIIASLWAIVATVMVVRNPLPFPDRGHRLFGVPNERARITILNILKQAGLSGRLRFVSGPSDQTILWDNTTVIHQLDRVVGDELSGTGISVVVRDPQAAADDAMRMLTSAGFTAEQLPPSRVGDLPTGSLVVISSNAFLGWALAFRRHQLRMPKPHFLAVE